MSIFSLRPSDFLSRPLPQRLIHHSSFTPHRQVKGYISLPQATRARSNPRLLPESRSRPVVNESSAVRLPRLSPTQAPLSDYECKGRPFQQQLVTARLMPRVRSRLSKETQCQVSITGWDDY